MNLSPLQLERYFVTELSVNANRGFDPKKGTELTPDNLQVTPACKEEDAATRQWVATLRIQLQAGPEANVPYFLAFEIVGFFRVIADTYPQDKVASLVHTNATSVLYSTAREVLRSAMAHGPFPPLVLPTASFYQPIKKEAKKEAAKVST